jgi:ABC-type multidrug transport system ATPase subunit
MESFIRLVREAAERGQTVLFSTHQLEIAEAAADRIVFLRDGAAMFDSGAGRSGHGAARTETLRELFARMYGIPLRR